MTKKYERLCRCNGERSCVSPYRFAVNSQNKARLRTLRQCRENVFEMRELREASNVAFFLFFPLSFCFLLRSINLLQNFSPHRDLDHEISWAASFKIKRRSARQNSISSRVTCVTSQTNKSRKRHFSASLCVYMCEIKIESF